MTEKIKSPIYGEPDFLSKTKVEQIKTLQECYANAKETWHMALGHNKTHMAERAMNKWTSLLEERGAEPDPSLEGQFNGTGWF